MKNLILLLTGLLLSLSSYAEYAIYPQVSSEILWIAKSGDNLKKGAVLVKLDARLAQQKLKQQQAILAVKQLQFNDKKFVFRQIKRLFDNLVRSKREFELAEIDYQQAQGEMLAQKSLVEQQKLWVEKHQILAPFDLQVLKVPNPRNATNQQHPKPLLLVKPSNSQ